MFAKQFETSRSSSEGVGEAKGSSAQLPLPTLPPFHSPTLHISPACSRSPPEGYPTDEKNWDQRESKTPQRDFDHESILKKHPMSRNVVDR